MSDNPKVWCIIPAGGVGARMAGSIPKQYLEINGSAILHHTLSRICACDGIDGVIVGLSPEDSYWKQKPFDHAKLIGTFFGGDERAHTVLNGLKFLMTLPGVRESDWALVHDAVRPCVGHSDIMNLISRANINQKGAVLGLKVVDTLKMVNHSDEVEGTENRNNYWRALTPQIFRIDELICGIEFCMGKGILVTDESMAMEQLNISPSMVEGQPQNQKVTVPGDLELIKLYLENFER